MSNPAIRTDMNLDIIVGEGEALVFRLSDDHGDPYADMILTKEQSLDLAWAIIGHHSRPEAA